MNSVCVLPVAADIRLDWETLNRDRKLECKLLDLIVTYGDLFPLKDEQGNEVMPQGAGERTERGDRQSPSLPVSSPDV